MILVRRYANRKLYDTTRRCYCSLGEIGEMVLAGTDVQVVDHDSEEDITGPTLVQMMVARHRAGRRRSQRAEESARQGTGEEIEASHPDGVATPRSELAARVDAEITRRIERMQRRGMIAAQDAMGLLLLLVAADPLESAGWRATEGRGELVDASALPTRGDFQYLAAQVDELTSEVSRLLTLRACGGERAAQSSAPVETAGRRQPVATVSTAGD